MKPLKYLTVLVLLLSLIVPTASSQMPEIPDTGELFGDLYVILRDEDGVPILADYTMEDENGVYTVSCVQPISSVTATATITTNEGEEEIQVYAGEPFALPTYVDALGDVVECELTEEMLAWVQAVNFGRLNLGRAPDSVIDHAFDEAINKMNVAQSIGIDPAGRLILTIPDQEGDWVAKTVDSPAENLALYIKMMQDGHWITTDTTAIVKDHRPDNGGPPDGDGPSLEPRPVLSDTAILLLEDIGYGGLGEVYVFDDDGEVVIDENGDPVLKTGEDLTRDELLLAASLLAAAADKTGSITLDKVMYINSIYGINQIGSIVPDEGKIYFDFGIALGNPGSYDRASTYGARQSGGCGDGEIWVLQPEGEDLEPDTLGQVHYVTTCMEILGYENAGHDPLVNAVHFTDMDEIYDTEGLVDYLVFDSNVRGFAQAADDALRVLEYIHNYKTPEDLYGVYTSTSEE